MTIMIGVLCFVVGGCAGYVMAARDYERLLRELRGQVEFWRDIVNRQKDEILGVKPPEF